MALASIVGFAALAFLGPVILFITAFVIYKRVKQHRESSKLSNIGGDDHNWPEDLKRKSDLSRLTNASEVPLVVIGGKRGPARSYSIGSSMIAAQSPESSTPASSTTCSSSSRSPRGCSPERSPQGTPRSFALLTPPPAAAVHVPGHCSLEPETLLQQQQPTQQQPAQQQQQQGGYCVVQMSVGDTVPCTSAAGQQRAPQVPH